jgi:hypothetical protein
LSLSVVDSNGVTVVSSGTEIGRVSLSGEDEVLDDNEIDDVVVTISR